jgi:rhomboid family GlyGly-CTERM serine protease
VSRHAPFFALALTCALAAAAGPAAFEALAYLRHAVLAGEAWRLLTTHLVHADGTHLAWNLGGLALVALAVARELAARQWIVVIVGAGIGGPLGVLLLSPHTAAMAGLSDLLHGLLAAGGIAALRRDRRLGVVVLLALVAKLAAEQVGVWPAGVRLGRPTATDAHLCGALAGAVVGMALVLARAMTTPPYSQKP